MDFRNKKFLLMLALTLVGIEIFSMFLMYKSFNSKDVHLEHVNLKEESHSEMFAVLLQQTDGTYEKYTDAFNAIELKYVYNSAKSGCMDSKGNIIENSLLFDNANRIATIEASGSSSCYLYFDLDTVPPQSFTFYLGGSENPVNVTSLDTTAYLSWTDTDITDYCITNTLGSDNCVWQDASGTTATSSYTLTNESGTKTAYAYLKDAAGNISDAVVDTVEFTTSIVE